MSETRRPPHRRAGAKAVLVEPTADALPFDVVAAKIQAPPAAGAVSRTALVNRLRAGATARVVSVVAPPGYGKTTLLAQWAARDGRRFAWISLDRRDDDPVVLLRHVAAALNRLEPLDARVLNALASPAPAVWDTVVPKLAAAVAASEQAVLVFDGTHVLGGDSVEILAVLAEHVPAGSTAVFSTRSECPLAARLRLGGILLELGPDDLALTRREGELLLRSAGAELPGDACDDLLDTAEGWAGALQLAALAALSPAVANEHDGEPRSFDADNRYVTTYIRAECLDGLGDEQREFLRRTSLLERMSGPLCDAVLSRKHSARELEAIDRSNLFLVPLDSKGEWYRYHHLVRALLRRELGDADADLVPELAWRAADWFEQRGDSESALEYALAAGGTDRAARLLGAVALPAACNGRGDAATGWLSAFDHATLLERHPAVAVQGACIHAMRGETSAAERWLAVAERSAEADPTVAPRLAVVRAAMCRDGVGTMLSDARSAVAGLAADAQWLPLALLVYAAAYVMLGDRVRADELLRDAAEGARRAGLGVVEIVATSERMLISEDEHELARVDAQASDLSELLATGAFESASPCAIHLAASARARLRHGSWEEARALLDRARSLTTFLTDAIPWLSVQTRLELVEAFVALRDQVAAEQLLDEIDGILALRPDLGVLVERAQALRTSLATLPTGEPGRNPGLTGAELRLLPFLTTHLSFREIGERLYLSRNTIKTQAISVYRKLGVSTRSDAMDRALTLGLVDETVQARTLAHDPRIVRA